MKPDVSVLMAVYNGARHLPAAIDSILSQTHRNFELVIVDDGSTDRSADIAAARNDGRINLIRLPHNRGLSTALNEGLRAAAAPLIARQDADDLAEPERLARQLAFMNTHQDVALLGTQGTVIAEDDHVTGVVTRPTGQDSIRFFSIFDNPFIHTSVTFKAAVAKECGGYNAAYDPFSQDYDLWCRIAEHHAIANLDERLIRYRVSETSIIGAVRDDGSNNEYDRGFDRVVRELTLRQARRLLGADAVSDSEADLLAAPVRGLPPDRVNAFLSLFDRLLDRFGGDRDGGDFNATLARLFDAVAFRLRPSSRIAAAAIYLHAGTNHPAALRHISWERMASLLAFGRSGRDRIGQWWRG
ncbi:MAG: glycosyltransferase [Cyanobacteria bacterium]|nr:glycosyltransferase [Cyanobacteriota bacterium]